MDNACEFKKFSPACERNQTHILEILDRYFSPKGTFLEIASGSGQHADFFTAQRKGWIWQPSDPDSNSIQSIRAYRGDTNRANFRDPLVLSTSDSDWDLGNFDGALCCNMIHISPWKSCTELFAHMTSHLEPGKCFVLYGPFIEEGKALSESNTRFDAYLKSQNPNWGIRQLRRVKQIGDEHQFEFINTHAMPANNLTVVFRRL